MYLPKEGFNCFNSNMPLSLQCIILFAISTENVKSLVLCTICESLPYGGKWYNETHQWQTDAVRRIFHLLYTSNEVFEILHKQWMSLLAVYHPICRTMRIPQISSFCKQFESQHWYDMTHWDPSMAARCCHKQLPSGLCI